MGGCVSRRGDMECLLYVIIEWLGGHLPWDTDDDERLKPTKIQEMKIDAFHNIEDFLTNKCQFKDKAYPPVLKEMMNYVSKMKFEEEPDYHHFRSLFRPANIDNSGDVEMGENNNKENKKLPAIAEDEEVVFKSPMQKKRSNLVEKRRVSSRVSCRVSRPWDDKEMETYNKEKTAIIKVENEASLKNPTPQMEKALERIQLRKDGLLKSLFGRRKAGSNFGSTKEGRRRAGMRQNSECENKDPLKKVQKTPMKALKSKGYVYEGKLQFPIVSDSHYLPLFELLFDNSLNLKFAVNV